MDVVVTDVSQIWPGLGGTSVLALEHFSHRFHSRRITCLLGPSGCGKSTLIQIIAGLERATGGSVRIEDPQRRGVEHPLGVDSVMVWQNLNLFPWRSVIDNVAFGLEMRGMAKAARYERAALAFAEPSPEVVALGRERRGAVLAGLEQLGADDRLVLHLRYFLDLAEAEVAAALGCPRGTVKSRLHRALARLRPLLATAFPELVGSAGREEEIPA